MVLNRLGRCIPVVALDEILVEVVLLLSLLQLLLLLVLDADFLPSLFLQVLQYRPVVFQTIVSYWCQNQFRPELFLILLLRLVVAGLGLDVELYQWIKLVALVGQKRQMVTVRRYG